MLNHWRKIINLRSSEHISQTINDPLIFLWNSSCNIPGINRSFSLYKTVSMYYGKSGLVLWKWDGWWKKNKQMTRIGIIDFSSRRKARNLQVAHGILDSGHDRCERLLLRCCSCRDEGLKPSQNLGWLWGAESKVNSKDHGKRHASFHYVAWILQITSASYLEPIEIICLAPLSQMALSSPESRSKGIQNPSHQRQLGLPDTEKSGLN